MTRPERRLCAAIVVLAALVCAYVGGHLVAALFSSPASTQPPTWTAAAGTTTSAAALFVPATTVAPTTSSSTTSTTTVPLVNIWDRLADCESGEWDRHRRPIPGSRNWADRRGGYEGGLHFAPSTWDDFRPDGFPEAAYLATREQQITVAHLVLKAQGWGAWPVCSYKVGAR